jgi:hypothetical protein
MGEKTRLDFGWLVIPITLLAGFLLGRKLHGTVGLTVSAVAGALAYMLGLVILLGPAAVLMFDLFSQILMVVFGALAAIFGWLIGENYELLFRRNAKKKTI